jgi:hypothetical protein
MVQRLVYGADHKVWCVAMEMISSPNLYHPNYGALVPKITLP